MNVSSRGDTRLLRTCIACGHKSDRDTLARVIRSPSGDIVIDWRRNLRGRGAHVCPTRRCVERAIGRQLFNRAFKGSVKYPSSKALLGTMHAALWRQIETLIRSGASARLLGIGATATEQALKTGRAQCLVLAKDSANNEKLIESAAKAGVPINYIENKDQLGAFAGRTAVGKMAVLNDKLASALLSAFGRLEMLD